MAKIPTCETCVFQTNRFLGSWWPFFKHLGQIYSRGMASVPSPGTNELPIRPKNLRIRPQKYFFRPRLVLMLPGVKIPKVKSLTIFWKNPFFKIMIFKKIGRNIMKISEICINFREESDFDHPRAQKWDPGQIF